MSGSSLTKREVRRLFDRWVAAIAANGPYSPQGRAALVEMVDRAVRDGATAEQTESLLGILVDEAMRVHHAGLRSLSAGLALQ
jgi:hypothetical protein